MVSFAKHINVVYAITVQDIVCILPIKDSIPLHPPPNLWIVVAVVVVYQA